MEEYSNIKNENGQSPKMLEMTSSTDLPDLSLEVEREIIVYGQNIKNSKPRTLGGLSTYFYFRNSPLIVIGNRPLKAVIVCSLILLFQVIAFDVIEKHFEFGIIVVYSLLIIVFNATGFLVGILNPGIPPNSNYLDDSTLQLLESQAEEDKEKLKLIAICRECNIVVKRELKTIHCENCRICIYSGLLNRSC